MILLIAIIVVFVLIYNSERKRVANSKEDGPDDSATESIEASIAQLSQDILKELDKPEPDSAKLKELKQKIDDLKRQKSDLLRQTNKDKQKRTVASRHLLLLRPNILP